MLWFAFCERFKVRSDFIKFMLMLDAFKINIIKNNIINLWSYKHSVSNKLKFEAYI